MCDNFNGLQLGAGNKENSGGAISDLKFGHDLPKPREFGTDVTKGAINRTLTVSQQSNTQIPAGENEQRHTIKPFPVQENKFAQREVIETKLQPVIKETASRGASTNASKSNSSEKTPAKDTAIYCKEELAKRKHAIMQKLEVCDVLDLRDPQRVALYAPDI